MSKYKDQLYIVEEKEKESSIIQMSHISQEAEEGQSYLQNSINLTVCWIKQTKGVQSRNLQGLIMI